ncbi:hypothetical protein KZX46_21090 (plasmid) [Polymorphobacter sp. PAMC 29334]|uniref:hypothetical protein n=1 Tax=Polymorphobacter sp. PAMC 29334 TaxID=2862331 RepID=UPI001C74BDF7|nr:hypothetical protein [Polymorphobacter sp. PAMC 29334]QYE37011.1 hypothetical protein KZX46_21090 [Polymorphobacter sp. PAMC 29334]
MARLVYGGDYDSAAGHPLSDGYRWGQTPEQPGRFGTFDNIRRKKDVRYNLAVRWEWKPKISSVVTYEVVQALPVRVGPVGPQVDGRECTLLLGRWSQFEIGIPQEAFPKYIRVIGTRRLN